MRLPHLTSQQRTDLNMGSLTGEAKTKAAGLLIYNTDDNILEFWDGTNWITAKTVEPWMVSGAGPDYSVATLNTQNIFHMGTVTIGDKAIPNAAVALNVATDNKGVLLPQVALKSPTDQETVPNPPVGLLVYNLGTESTFDIVGYLFWSGTEWKLFNSSTSTPAQITSLNCLGAILSPGSYTSGVKYEGVVKISYAGGNGGYYTGGSSFTSNGLTFTLQDGKLENGAGEIVLRVEGIPNISSPTSITIPINPALTTDPGIRVPFWSGGPCSAVVGAQVTADIKAIAVMDYMRFVTDEGTNVKGFTVECTTPDGLYTVRAFLKHSNQTSAATATNNTELVTSGVNNNVQIRNNSDVEKTIMWNYNTDYGGYLGDAGGNLKLPSKRWGGGIGNTWTSLTTTAGLYAPWGDPGIYNASNVGPEHRRYTWIDTSNTTKVAYTITVMSGIDPGAASTSDPTKQKVFIRIEQIVAL